MKIFVLFTILFFANVLVASECEITKEYHEARVEAYKKSQEIHTSYNECRDSMRAAFYWKAIAACTEKGLGKEIGGGCGHLVSNGSYPMETPDKSHCEIFKVPKEVEAKYRSELMDKINVQKCKT